MMMLILLCVILFAIPASAEWPNEPPGSTPLLNCAFDTPNCNGALLDVYNSARVTQPGGFTLSPPNALVSTLHPCGGGGCTGGMSLTYPANTAAARPLRELFVLLEWRTNPEFEGNVVSGNKLFFMNAKDWLFGGMQTAGFFYMKGQPNAFPHQIVWGHNTGGLDNSHICALDLGLVCWPNVKSTPIYPGTKYRLSAYVKASSCPTCRDGVVKWWVNDELNGSYTNVNYGNKIVNQFFWAQTWDGTPAGNGCCPTRKWEHYVDHLYISAPNAGEIATPPVSPPPVTPPPVPPATNLPSPTILAPIAGAVLPSGSTEFRWTAVPGAMQYILNVHEEGQPYECNMMTYCSNLPGTSKLITTKPGKKYDFWVFGIDDKGNPGSTSGSAFTAQASVTPPPVTPPPVTPPTPPVTPPVPPIPPTGPAFSNIQNGNEEISFQFDETRCPKGTRRFIRGRDTKTITITCER